MWSFKITCFLSLEFPDKMAESPPPVTHTQLVSVYLCASCHTRNVPRLWTKRFPDTQIAWHIEEGESTQGPRGPWENARVSVLGAGLQGAEL